MTKPNYADWATDDNYPAGPNTWNGTPTKVAPISGEVQTGHVPATFPPAQKANYQENLHGRWVRWLDAGDIQANNLLMDAAPAPEPSGGGAANRTVVDLTQVLYVFAPSAGSAAPVQGSANNKIKVGKGTLLQGVSATQLLGYTFDGTDEVTIANAAGAVPRVDLVQVKIEPDETVDGRRTKVTIGVKQGTPGASPAVPAPDSGYVAYCTVLVGASYAAAAGFGFDDAAGAVAILHDQRMPLDVRHHQVFASNCGYDASTWTPTPATQTITAGVAPGDVLFRCPNGEGGGRVVGAGLFGLFPATHTGLASNFTLVRSYYSDTFGYVSPGIAGFLGTFSTVGGVSHRVEGLRGDFDFTHTPNAGPTVTAYVSGSGFALGVPVWANGRRCWRDPVRDTHEFNSVAIRVAGNVATQTLHKGWFWIAG